mgnify:FL=1
MNEVMAEYYNITLKFSDKYILRILRYLLAAAKIFRRREGF